MTKEYKNPGVLEFDAPIEQEESATTGGWITFPYDLKETFGVGNLIPVIVTFDDVEYRGSIANMGSGPMLLIRNDVYAKLGKKRGDMVHVTVTLDDKPRVVEIPHDVETLLNKHPNEKAKFEKLAYSHKREYVNWITSAKQEETRQRRLDKFIEELKKK